jgi:hypothetical protein
MLVSLPPSSLTAAKQAAIGLYRSRKSGKPKDEWIRGLDQTVANEIDRAYWTKEKRKWPVDLMGGQRHRAKKPRMTVESRQAILDTERVDEPAPLKAEEVQLEHYEGWLSQASRLSRPQGQARGGRMSGPAPQMLALARDGHRA